MLPAFFRERAPGLIRFGLLAAWALLRPINAAAIDPAAINTTTINPRATISAMIVGDSISQGREGDWTWRYRIWQWCVENDIAINFFGPHLGTAPQQLPGPPLPPPLYGQSSPGSPPLFTGGYAAGIDPGFLTNDYHFAIWGQQIAEDIGPIESVVASEYPDYLLVELGFNDMGWLISDATGTIVSMELFITNARAGRPDIKFAIANVPQRSYIGGRDDLITKTDQYNTMLAELIPSWSTDESPIYLVDFRDNYSCEPEGGCPAGTDGLHPNALGEYEIAKAFADTLYYAYGLGNGPLSIPDTMPDRPCPTPTNIAAVTSIPGVTVTWDEVYGAYGYIVYIAFDGGPYSTWNTTAPRYDTVWTIAGISWTYQVQAVCGNEISPLTDVVGATANPTVAPGPSNIDLTSNADGIELTWDAVEGDYDIPFYSINYWDTSLAGAYVTEYSFTGTSADITGLPPGDDFLVAIQTWEIVDGIYWAGLPAVAGSVVVGGNPQPPSNFEIRTINEGATIQMTWDADPYAAEYRIWTRYLLNDTDYLKPGSFSTSETCYGATYLFPGAWNYEFCITAKNGDYETVLSGCTTAPETISTVDACPVPATTPVGGGSSAPGVSWLPPASYTPAPYPPATAPTYTWPRNHVLVGFGDSYAAGIGAGDWVEKDYWDPDDVCYRGKNAYPYEILHHLAEATSLYHLACTGAVSQDIIGTPTQRKQNQLDLFADDWDKVGWATLSIGGNDAGFGQVAYTCLATNSDDCYGDIEKASAIITSENFRVNVLQATYDAVMKAAQNTYFLLIVTGYIKFFDTSTTDCDKQYFLIGHYLTQGLRDIINEMVDEMNLAIQQAVNDAGAVFTDKQIMYFDTDSLFEGHRFCTPGQDWRTDAWFLTVNGNDEEPGGIVVPNSNSPEPIDNAEIVLSDFATTCNTNDTDLTLAFICNYAIYVENGGTPDPDIGSAVWPGLVMKAFHPKSIGHDAIGKGIGNFVDGLQASPS